MGNPWNQSSWPHVPWPLPRNTQHQEEPGPCAPHWERKSWGPRSFVPSWGRQAHGRETHPGLSSTSDVKIWPPNSVCPQIWASSDYSKATSRLPDQVRKGLHRALLHAGSRDPPTGGSTVEPRGRNGGPGTHRRGEAPGQLQATPHNSAAQGGPPQTPTPQRPTGRTQ